MRREGRVGLIGLLGKMGCLLLYCIVLYCIERVCEGIYIERNETVCGEGMILTVA